MTTMKITDKMADAIKNAQPTQTLEGERLKITSDVHDRVCAGLQNRELVEYVKVSENISRMVLSARGEAVRQMLTERPAQRGFGENSLDRAVEAAQPEPVNETVTISLMVKQAGSSEGFVVDSRTVPSTEITSARADLITWTNRNPIPYNIGHESRWIYYVTLPSAPKPPEVPAPTGNANVREVSKVLKAAGFTPRNGERVMARSGYQASQDGSRVRITWRGGSDTDLMGDNERDDVRCSMNDAYAAVLKAAGYPVDTARSGRAAYVTGPKRKS